VNQARNSVRDFSVILMLTAVAGAVAHLVGVAIDVGRAAGWWQ
jgi:hypothetical protein